MFRYVALIWDDARELHRETVALLARKIQTGTSEWRCGIDLPGLKVFCADERAGSLELLELPKRGGVVLGTAFEPLSNSVTAVPPRKEFSIADVLSFQATQGRSIVDLCWGRYVAIVREPARRVIHVIRDPTGALPCYRTTFLDVEVFFSAIEDVARLGLLKFNVDWDYIAARVSFQSLHSRETALAEVSDLLPGERITLRGGESERTFVWNPLDIARTDTIESPDEAAYEMRRAARSCINAWAACHPAILHTLSGGLDSAIVLGCLARTPSRPRLTCLNYHSAGCDGDERHFARLAATHNGCVLVERERSEQVDLWNLLSIERSCTPTFYLHALQSNREVARLAADSGATAIFGGGGGDQLFYQTQAILGAVDRLRIHGLGRRYLQVALDTAHLARLSIWSVVGQSLRLALLATQWDPRREASDMRKLMTPGALRAAIDRGGYLHPLFERPGRTPPGKLWHAWSLSIPQEFYDPRGDVDDAERIQPLISQPLLEVCLRIATYVMTAGGWDRSIARQAFRKEVPPEILKRRSKGGMEEHVQTILQRNIRVARDLLLNGHLVERKLLDRNAVTEVLSGDPTRIPGALTEIFDHLSIEAWLRRWHPIPLTAARDALHASPAPRSLTG